MGTDHVATSYFSFRFHAAISISKNYACDIGTPYMDTHYAIITYVLFEAFKKISSEWYQGKYNIKNLNLPNSFWIYLSHHSFFLHSDKPLPCALPPS